MRPRVRSLMRCEISVCDVEQCGDTGGPGNDHCGEDVRRGFSNGLHRDMDF